MANNFVRSPWIIDTASATTVKAGRTWVNAFTWSGYTDATHKCIIKDSVRAIVLYTLDGNTDLTPISLSFGNPVSMHNIAVTTLGSGILAIDID